MNRCFMWLILSASLLLQGVATAQAPRLLPAPNLNLWAQGEVSALAPTGNGSMIIGGDFEQIQGVPRRSLAKVNAFGTVLSTWGPVLGGGLPSVNSIAVSGTTGDVYISGSFISVNGQARLGLAKLDSEGQLDPDWNPAPENGGLAVQINSLAIVGNEIFVSGNFTSMGGLARSGLAKISLSGSGQTDPLWNPPALNAGFAQLATDFTDYVYVNRRLDGMPGASRIAAIGNGTPDATWQVATDADVYTIGPDLNGSVFIGGAFTTVQSTARTALAKVSTGAGAGLDQNWNAGVQGVVHGVYVAAGTVDLVGLFSSVGGLPRQQVARVSASGTGIVDMAFAPSVDGGLASAIARDINGSAFVGGRFTLIDGQPHSALVKIGIFSTQMDVESRGWIDALSNLPDGSLAVGGRFTRIGNVHRQNLVRITSAGAVDPTWGASVSGIRVPLVQPPGEPGGFDWLISVWTLASDSSGRVYVGGAFEQVGGVTRRNIARIGTDGELDLSWNPDADGVVAAFALGEGSEVFVGGNFSQIGGQARASLAKLSTDAGAALDSSWTPALELGALPTVMLHDGAGSVFVGGIGIGSVNGVACCGGVAKLSATGTGARDGSWNFRLMTPRRAHSMVLDGAGFLYIGGLFDQVSDGTNFYDRAGLVRVSAVGDATVDPVWNPSTAPPFPSYTGYTSLALGSDQRVYASYDDGANSRVYAYSTAGAGDPIPSWDVITNDRSNVLLLRDQTLFVGGSFSTITGQARRGLAALQLDQLLLDGFED